MASLSYFQIIGKTEEVNESSYTSKATGEIQSKVQFSLVVPGMRDRVLCELPLVDAPTTDTMDKWEMEESWVVVSAEGMRALAFERSNARAGEKSVGSLVVFQAAAIREANAEERRELQQARKAQKLKAKQARAARQAEKQARKEAEAAQQADAPAKQSA